MSWTELALVDLAGGRKVEGFHSRAQANASSATAELPKRLELLGHRLVAHHDQRVRLG